MSADEPVRLGELPLVLTVPEAGRLCRIGRGAAYDAVRRGQIPSVRIGHRLLVPTERLLAMLGVGIDVESFHRETKQTSRTGR